MTVHAPFRFAPIHRWVWFPDWGPLVSHDVPFKDGLSGEIAIEITAETPLLVGGARRKASNNREGAVRPFLLPDGRYAIPSSALQGMVRSILECVGFGRLGPFVDSRRFGFRDISPSKTGTEYYRERMTTNGGGPPPQTITQHARAGWLIRAQDGLHRIVPCQDFARVRYDEIRLLKGGMNPDPGNVMGARNDARDRYSWFLGAAAAPKTGLNVRVHLGPSTPPHVHAGGRVQIAYQRAFAAAGGALIPIDGTLVFTGKTKNGLGPGDKKFEFIFHTPDRANAAAALTTALPIEDSVWEDFAYIHNHDRLPGRKENPNWEYWRSEYDAGQPVPVFFLLESGRISTFGTAFMFKAALPLSTHDMLRNSSEHHLLDRMTDRESGKKLDFPSLIFGLATDASKDAGPAGLKRRASFDTAITAARPEHGDLPPHRVTLLEPKPSYFPSYVRQPGNQTTGTLDSADQPFAIYYASPRYTEPERVSPELAGIKIWPARNRVVAQDTAGEVAVQSELRALPSETVFKATLRVHNLRPPEVGALLWALTFGEAAACSANQPISLRHRLGMGKPYGFGEITIRLKQIELRDMGGNATTAGVQGYISKFIESIEREAEAQGVRMTTNKKFDWANTVQVKTVLKAANSTLGQAADTVVPEHSPLRQFDYMQLQIGHGGHNYFQDAKRQNAHQNGRFLPRYADGAEMRRAGVAAPAPVSPPPGAAGTPMYDIDEGVEVTFVGPASRNGFGRVDYGDGEGPVEVRLTRLRPP